MSHNNSFRRMDSSGSRGGGGSFRRGGRNSRVDTSGFPSEQGIICSLKESFGFIHCAQRPEEIFFHYSEVRNEHPDDLQIDMEVEFKIGSSEKNADKLAAYEVVTVPTGTVIWETEEEAEKKYQGLVEKTARTDNPRGNSNNNNNSTEGTIRVVLKPDAPEDDEGKYGELIKFRPDEYQPENNPRNNRLFRGDLLEFRILTDRRTNKKYARYISLLQTEKERREERLLRDAVPEEGVIIALNKGFGFLKSNKRHEHVYFHFSNFGGSDSELRKGQEVKFLVVTEESKKNDGQPPKCSARKLECLPKGSVVFHHVVAKGVKGIVTMIPQPPASGDRGYADDKDGTIRLIHPMESDAQVKDVSLQFSDAPGGVYTYQHRGQSVNGLWIQQGDILLFDVVKELADGSYRAAPTRHTIAVGGEIVPPSKEEEENNSSDEGKVRLVSLSLIGRAEGTIHTIKPQSGYGFIHFAERPIDVHFSTYNILPEELQADLRRQLGVEGDDPVMLDTGASVQFDICAHGTVQSGARGRHGRGGGGGGQHERENVKGHRVLLLPPSTVKMEMTIASGVKGTIRSADTKQLYAGFVDLDDDIQPMPEEDRHPLVVQMVQEFVEEIARPFGRESLVYHDVLSVKEDDVVVNILKSKASGKLTYTHIPVAGLDAHPGRLCIRRVAEEKKTEEEEKEGEEGKGEGKEKSARKKKEQKPNKNLRFDKASLEEEFKNDIPPGTGDIVTCDIAQSRRTGKLVVKNLQIVERVEREAGGEEATGTSGIGVVKDVVPNRNFGFISLFDENATKREMLFFQLSEGGGGGKGSKKFNVRRGDEVKFDISVDKSGKRVAKNVQMLPKGSIPSKESKNACKGFILMEPSHTSLSDTPNRKAGFGAAANNGAAGGRWGNVGKEDNTKTQNADIHEKGCILLLEDKIGMFTGKPTTRKRSKSIDDDARSVDSIDSIDSIDDGRSVDSTDGATTDDDAAEIGLNSHLKYLNGAIAISGVGSSSTMDSKAAPRRGDMVSFIKARRGKGIRDIRIVKRQAATLLRGRLESIDRAAGRAKFFAATQKEETYEISLSEVVSCDPGILKEKESVEGILHENKIFGICRTADLYLESKLGTSHKERPKLNLSVKKNRGGTIIAQSMMAKGPDGTNGFAPGWTTRQSQYAPPASS